MSFGQHMLAFFSCFAILQRSSILMGVQIEAKAEPKKRCLFHAVSDKNPNF